MEGNRDEAERCLNIATSALEAGDKEQAVKFLNKAQRLFPTDRAKALLDALTKNGSSAGNGAYRRRPTESSDSTGARPDRESQESGGGDSAKGFTKDQVEGVQSWHQSESSAHTFTNGRTSYSHQTDHRQERTEERGDGGFSMIIQLMPIVVLILVSILSQMMVSPPPYSLYSRPSTGQTLKRQTENLHVDYYVSKDFKSEFKGSALQQIEKNVEEDYVANVRNNCWKERQTKTDLLYAAKVYRDDRMRKKAEHQTMDNCKELDRLNNLFRGG
nr:PREDICTED: dnaJ homolog subfamily B member 14-like [Paralichthys olivaceus]